jgi:hypothetical protein
LARPWADLTGFPAARQGVVAELARRVARAVHADGGRLIYLALTGAEPVDFYGFIHSAPAFTSRRR